MRLEGIYFDLLGLSYDFQNDLYVMFSLAKLTFARLHKDQYKVLFLFFYLERYVWVINIYADRFLLKDDQGIPTVKKFRRLLNFSFYLFIL